MADIQITPDNILKKVSELETACSQIKAKIEKLEQIKLEQQAVWKGEASDAFRAVFERSKAELESFYASSQEYIQVLRNVANNYIKVENQNIDLINGGRH